MSEHAPVLFAPTTDDGRVRGDLDKRELEVRGDFSRSRMKGTNHDRFDFVFSTPEEDPCIVEKTKIGEGGFGTVFKCVIQPPIPRMQITYALKESNQFDLTNKDQLKDFAGFWSEWIYMSSVTHYHGIRAIAVRCLPKLPLAARTALTDFVSAHGLNDSQKDQALAKVSEAFGDIASVKAFVVMEYFESKNLGSWKTEHQSDLIEFQAFIDIVAQCCIAVGDIHTLEVVHNDIKPLNFLIDDTGFVKLCDYGSMQKVDKQPTNLGVTMNYVAPERQGGDRPGTIKSDIYSLGRCLEEIYLTCVQRTSSDRRIKILAITFRTKFIAPMIDADPDLRPTIADLFTKEPFTDFLALANLQDIERRGRETFDRISAIYNLKKTVTKGSSLLRALQGNVRSSVMMRISGLSDIGASAAVHTDDSGRELPSPRSHLLSDLDTLPENPGGPRNRHIEDVDDNGSDADSDVDADDDASCCTCKRDYCSWK